MGAADDVFGIGLVQQASVLAVERRRRHAAQRSEQAVFRGQQVTLRRHPALGRFATGVIAPRQLAVLRVDGEHGHTFGRENAGAEVGGPVVHQHAGADGPQRDHLAAAQYLAFVRGRVELPLLAAVAGPQAVDEAVVGAEVHLVLPDRRRQPHGPARERAPTLPARGGVQRHHFAVRGRAEIDGAGGHGDVKSVVEMHAAQLGLPVPAADRPWVRLAPSRLRRVAGLEHPALRQRQLDGLRRHPAAGVVISVGRPVAGVRGRRHSHQNQHRQAQASSGTDQRPSAS